MSSVRTGLLVTSRTSKLKPEAESLLDVEESSTQAAESRPSNLGTVSLSRRLSAGTEEEYEEYDIAELQIDLENMHQEAVSEDELHKVPWGPLGVEFARNSIPSVLMIVFTVCLIKVTPHLFGFGLKPIIITSFTIMLVVFISFGIEQLQVNIGDTSSELPYRKRLLRALPLLQAIRGKKILKLSSRSEAYTFAQCLERHFNNPGAFVELVVNPENPEETRRILTIDRKEVLPSCWKCTSLYSAGRDYTEELQKAAMGELYPTLAQVMSGWVVKDPAFGVPCFAELAPATRWLHIQLLWDHWTIRVILSMAMLAALLTPGWQYLKTMRRLRIHYCKASDPTVLPVCGPDQDGNTCEPKCTTLMSFIQEVGSRLGVEEIEFIWTMVLALVLIYTFSLVYIWRRHSMLETKFILRMEGMSREARMEVMQVRKLLNKILSPCGVLYCLFRQCQALRHPIKACEPLTIDLLSRPSKVRNPWFWKAMEHVQDANLHQTTPYPISLPLADVEHHKADVKGVKQDLVTWDEKMDAMSASLVRLKSMHAFNRQKSYSVGGKKFKFCMSVPVTCRESLHILKTEFFTKAGPKGYAAQLDAIFRNADCQDSPGSGAGEGAASFCHVAEDFRAGPLLIPAGFCLTHVACKAPNGDLLSLEIGKDKDISSREAFMLLFYGKSNPNLNNSLVLERLCHRHQWPSIMLPSATSETNEELQPVDSQGLEAKMKDSFIYQFHFIFQISPQYFEALQRTEQDTNVSLYSFCEGMFDRMKSGPPEEPRVLIMKAIKKQSWQDCKRSQFFLVAEIDSSAASSRIAHLCIRLFHIMWIVIVSALFVLIVPGYRRFRWGGSFFPAPFTRLLALNASVKFVCLVCYLMMFSVVSNRLQAVGKAMAVFEQETLRGSSGGSKAKGEAPERDEGDPLKLSIGDTEDYDPADEVWVARWHSQEKSLLHWHLCTRYMRILMSRARLTSQAILVGAAAILVCMLLVDLVQALHGYGAMTLNKEAIFKKIQRETMRAIDDSILDAAHKGAGVVESVGKTVAKAVEKAGDEEFGRRLLDSHDNVPWDFTGATQTLVHALAPFSEAVDRVRERQLLDLAHQWSRAQKFVNIADVQKVSGAQLLTICMTMLLLAYSAVLLYRIAIINDKMESHGNMLVQVKESHLQGFSVRQANTAARESDSPPTEVGEYARKSYERMLDMCIEAAHTHKDRFAFRLFCLVITRALLVAWVCTAAQPMVQQLAEVSPVLLGHFCHWLGNSTLGSALEGQAEALEKGLAQEVLHYKAETQENMFYSLVCDPLFEVVRSEARAGASLVEEGKTVADDGRRRLEDEHMLSHHALTPLVEDWWGRSPGHPRAKLALVQAVLQERLISVRRLLMAGPEAMKEAVLSRRLGTAGSTVASSRPWGPRRLPP